MKRFLSFLSIVTCLVFCSCSKDNLDADRLEGTWALVHIEARETLDGKIIGEEKEDYNPFSPINDDQKLELLHTSGETYVATTYYWQNGSWKLFKRVDYTIKGNKLYRDGLVLDLSLSGDTLTMSYSERVESFFLGDGTIVTCHYKIVFKKMGGISSGR